MQCPWKDFQTEDRIDENIAAIVHCSSVLLVHCWESLWKKWNGSSNNRVASSTWYPSIQYTSIYMPRLFSEKHFKCRTKCVLKLCSAQHIECAAPLPKAPYRNANVGLIRSALCFEKEHSKGALNQEHRPPKSGNASDFPSETCWFYNYI